MLASAFGYPGAKPRTNPNPQSKLKTSTCGRTSHVCRGQEEDRERWRETYQRGGGGGAGGAIGAKRSGGVFSSVHMFSNRLKDLWFRAEEFDQSMNVRALCKNASVHACIRLVYS